MTRVNISKALILLAFLVFFASLVTYKIPLASAEDLPRQIRNGYDIVHGNFDVLYKNVYSYTDPDHEFANHHWLYGVYAYGLQKLTGFGGIVIAKVLVLVLTLGLLLATSLRKANFWLVIACAFPTVVLLVPRSAARPEMFSYFFVALYIFLLTELDNRPDSKKLFWIIPCQLLWANLHITFPLGVALVGSYWLATILKHPKQALKSPLVRKLTLVLILTCMVSMANPWGITGVIYSLSANTVEAGKIFSAEVQSITSVFKSEPKADYPAAVLFPWLVVALAISFVIGYKQKPLFYFFMSLATAVLSFSIIRGLPLFGLIFLPAMSTNLTPLFDAFAKRVRTRWAQVAKLASFTAPVVSLGVIVACAFVFPKLIMPYVIPGIGLTVESEDPALFIKEHNLHGPMLNDTDSGSYLTYYLYPDIPVFADNRFGDAYTHDFLENEYLGLFTDEAAWQAAQEKYGFNLIFLNHYNQGGGIQDFIYHRIYDPDWVWVYAGRTDVIFIRNLPEYQDVINTYGITEDNIYDKLAWLSAAPDFHGQVAAGDIYALAGSVRDAEFEYEKVLSQWPKADRVWYALGLMELTRADQANANGGLALLAMQQAIRYGYRTPVSYSYLVLAYYNLDRLDEAEAALKKELALDPRNADAAEWKRILAEKRLLEDSGTGVKSPF